MLAMLGYLVIIIMLAPLWVPIWFTVWFLIKGTPGETDPNKF
jgi:hypothetical protein